MIVLTLKANVNTKTERIFELTAPYNNPYQGCARRVLFVCSVGMLRSPAAADLCAREFGWNTRSCGTDLMAALIPLSVNLIAWADDIVFMNQENFLEAKILFAHVEEISEMLEKSSTIHISDQFDRDDTRLLCQIREKVSALDIEDATGHPME